MHLAELVKSKGQQFFYSDPSGLIGVKNTDTGLIEWHRWNVQKQNYDMTGSTVGWEDGTTTHPIH